MQNKNVNEIGRKVYDTPHKLKTSKKDENLLKEVLKKKSEYSCYYDFISSNLEISDILHNNRALQLEVQRCFASKENVQSGMLNEVNVLSTFAELYDLDKVCNLRYENIKFSKNILKNIPPNAKYLYYSDKQDHTYIIHISGPTCNDAHFYFKNFLYKIEIKDQKARSGDADVRYDETGKLLADNIFCEKYQTYLPFINEFNATQNVFSCAGHNIPLLTKATKQAVLLEYFCKNDIDMILLVAPDDTLTLITADDKDLINTSGSEIRTAGKNHTSTPFTPIHLKNLLNELGAKLVDAHSGKYIIKKDRLNERIGRGSKKVTGYKFSSLYYIKIKDVKEYDSERFEFYFNDICQNQALISVHLKIDYSFEQLRWNFFKNHLSIDNQEDRPFAIAEQLSLF